MSVKPTPIINFKYLACRKANHKVYKYLKELYWHGDILREFLVFSKVFLLTDYSISFDETVNIYCKCQNMLLLSLGMTILELEFGYAFYFADVFEEKFFNCIITVAKRNFVLVKHFLKFVFICNKT